VRAELSELRARIAQLPEGETEGTAEADVLLNVICAQDAAEPGQSAECENVLTVRIGARLLKMQSPGLKKVLNGTGTILHTNLGRAPLGKEAASRVLETVSGYCNLEYDLEDGCRGERCGQIENILCEITGAEAAVAVNNNAAALLLILCTLAQGGEVIVSRGELVEIGGQFRIPDVMKQSGAGLVEVGTTNRTRLSDYETAVTETTKAILKVHTSNYRIIGFTEETSIEQLTPLREKYGIPLVEDLGSGALLDLTKYGLPGEPNVQDALRRGADIVCFSGDKLLGGPQAGIIAGKKEYIEKMRSNPLFRALRIDKITAAFLETILLEYRSMERALVRIPTLRMLTQNEKEIAEDAAELKILLEQAAFDAEIALYPCRSKVGGGALPVTELPSMAVGIRPSKISAETLSRRLRRLPIPVVTRIEDENVLVDARTFEMEYASEFVRMLKEAEIFSGKMCAEEER
jgi:L-seryl-tRNA(Sec) selenium transferase